MISTTLQDVRDGQELKVIGRRISVLNEEKSKLKRKIGWRQQGRIQPVPVPGQE